MTEWGIHLMPRATAVRSFGSMDVAIIAGVTSTGLFAMSYLPMLVKAARTRDLSSYSLGNLAITNAGNLVHSVYVFSLPAGPIWFLHAFYLIASALMLGWFLRYRTAGERGQRSGSSPSTRASITASVDVAGSIGPVRRSSRSPSIA